MARGCTVRPAFVSTSWRSETLFIRNFTRNLLMFALGRVLQPSDMPAVRDVARQAAEKENRFSAFVLAVVSSTRSRCGRAETSELTSSAGAP